ncbi:SGNH/GDSL hydrolase family protein [Streptomyces sp. NRRL F-5755]|uniref:SGNH/GDSL hydrolase family protein n=1 Tax=Streptomyces sp. NRRL F-5755 TaxID=1519475 RepID=UPI0006AE006A|nr:SGNH/GDSL hydrolase family protein [Streptomyces sp. NRRL F-5755]
MPRRLRTPLLITTAILVASGPLMSQALAAETPTPTDPVHGAAAPAKPKPSSDPGPARVANPDTNLGKDWKKSQDRAVTGAADAKAYRILVADEAKAYDWKTVAALSEPGMPADSWIGNQCVMDRDHVAAVYAPRAFTNKPDLMQGGAFTAIVNTKTGDVTKLPFTGTLAYFDPTCNTTTHTAAFTQYRDMNDASKVKTQVITVDTAGKSVATTGELQGQVSSAAPVKDGVVAGLGRDLVHIDGKGKTRRLATGDSIPFDIRPMTGDRIGFVDRKDTKTAQAKVYDGHGKPRTIATGRLGDLDLVPGEQGRAFLTGKTKDAKTQGSGVTRIDAPADTDVSSHGRLAVDPVLTPGIRAGLTRIQGAGKGFDKADEPEAGVRDRSGQAPSTAGDAAPLTVTSTATTTGNKVQQRVVATQPRTGNVLSPALTGASAPRVMTRTAAAVSHDPRDTDRWCSVSRNDMSAQALQPTPNQVEWAVDMAVRGELRSKWIRQGDYRSQAGLGTIDPQGLFPLPKLKGGGRIPANVLLGILAQESNLWQAENGAVPGQMGNPLAATDGYYGHNPKDTLLGYWRINWKKSDCGYGVGQVTDGMRLAGHEKIDEKTGQKTETSLDPKLQKLIAIDYASNIAASMKILADKWNEVHEDGQKITVNNDDPSRVENWFTAAWNYNLGFNPKSAAASNGGNWGLGWYNNPANPLYKKGAWDHPFMDVSINKNNIRDAAHPQYWPYEEKVMGWAAWSIDTGFSYGTDGRQDWVGDSGFSSAGFRPAWWNNDAARSQVSPLLDTFCNEKNGCSTETPVDCPDEACYRKFWWNQENAVWKVLCEQSCGHESIKYETLRSEPGRGYRLQNGEPVCDTAPKGSEVVTSIPNGTQTWSKCGSASSKGSFEFTFYPDWDGNYEAKADLHSIGGGDGGHFWYSHTRNEDNLGGDGNRMTIKGQWTLGHKLDWARVLVHLPDTGAHTRQAAYVVQNADTKSNRRLVPQRADRWVSLGVFHFTGTPQVELSNVTKDGTADEDIAWGSVAFQPLPGKPKHSIVAMGDSYSSGEGASEGNRDYYPESNYRDKQNESTRNACHRSKMAWSRQAAAPGLGTSIGALDDSLDPRMDYHLIACSGARTYNVMNVPQNGELAQVEQGYLDQNTTLVTMSIGGNDTRFTHVIQKCLISFGIKTSCDDVPFEDEDTDIGGRDKKYHGWHFRQALPALIKEVVAPDIMRSIQEIHKRAENAKIVLMGYPKLISDNGSCLRLGAFGLSKDSNAWLDSVAGELAANMQKVADTAKAENDIDVRFSNPIPDFEGKGICGNPETIHGLVLHTVDSDNPIKDWPILRDYGLSAQSFHPKIAGARLYANSLERTMKDWVQ